MSSPPEPTVCHAELQIWVTFTPTDAIKYLVIQDNLEPLFGQGITLKGIGE
jgi:hypothetical protein